MNTVTMELAAGTILAGKYRVERTIGEGGMGVVIAATHVQLNQKVAVKLLRPQAMNNPSLLERFEREARAAARIHGEHAARVIDVGKLEGGLPYIVMEYLEGEDLEQSLRRRGPLSVFEAVDCVLQACDAIAEAHAANIVHRDLKPANLFLAKKPNEEESIIKVLDFGISKILEPEADAITKTSSLMGTAYYMSPEQLTNAKSVDTRTDIWALGVILYELLSGRRPFEAATMPEVVGLIIENNPTSLQKLRPDVPDALDRAIRSCLRRIDDRIVTVSDLASLLEPFSLPERAPMIARIHKLVAGRTIPPGATTRSKPPSQPPSEPSERSARIEIDPEAHSRSSTQIDEAFAFAKLNTTTDRELAVPKSAQSTNALESANTAAASLLETADSVRVRLAKPAPRESNAWKYLLGFVAVAGGGVGIALYIQGPREAPAQAHVSITSTSSITSASKLVDIAPPAISSPIVTTLPGPSMTVASAVPAHTTAEVVHVANTANGGGGHGGGGGGGGSGGGGGNATPPAKTSAPAPTSSNPLQMQLQ